MGNRGARPDGKNLLGVYELSIGADRYTLTVKGKPEAPEAGLLRADSSKIKANLSYDNGLGGTQFSAGFHRERFSFRSPVKPKSATGLGVVRYWTAAGPTGKPNAPAMHPLTHPNGRK